MTVYMYSETQTDDARMTFLRFMVDVLVYEVLRTSSTTRPLAHVAMPRTDRTHSANERRVTDYDIDIKLT